MADPIASGEGSVVEARGLSFEVDARRLLDRVALRAERGEVVGLVGPNGAGKSTLLRVLAGILRSTEGAVTLDGRDLARLSTRERATFLAMVPQSLPPTFGFTSVEVVTMGRYAHMDRLEIEDADDRVIALDAMHRTDSDLFASRQTSSLSGGERQRVFIARALAQQPSVLLLDEPTANLDIAHQIRVLDLVSELAQDGITVIVAVHDLAIAARYCQTLVLLDHGQVVADGPPAAVLTPERIRTVFGVRAITHDDVLTGDLAVSFKGLDEPRSTGPAEIQGLIHVVCGGGTGARLLYALQHVGLTVTAGPLGSGDTDRVVAEMLGIDCIPVTSFAPIPDEADERHRALIRASDAAVLCSMPVGANNLRNLEAVAEAAITLVSLETTSFAERDHTGGLASSVFERLQPVARCATPDEVVDVVCRHLRAKGNGT